MGKKTFVADKGGEVEARVLVSCQFGEPNDVVTLSAEEAEAAMRIGWIDTAVEAVAYAKSLAD